MRIVGSVIGRRTTAASASVVIGMAVLAGCAAKSTAAPNTVMVTVTASSESAGSAVDTTGVTVSALPSVTESASVSASVSESSAAESTSLAPPSMAPIVKLDPLQAKCDKVLDTASLGSALGSLPAGTGRVVEGPNDAIQRSGRLRCQYGVSDDKSSVAVTVVLAQYTSQEAAMAQMATTTSSEEQAGAKSSSAFIQGHPASILLRDGGLAVLNYDTWTLSVVVENGITTEDKLPAALTSLADFALSKVISQGG